MLRWAFYFFLVSMVAAVLGFTEIAAPAAAMARVFFWLFLAFFLVTLVTAVATARHHPAK
jgi:uncharacterized membrane protein YtjA (UPF0391 family)